MGLENQFHEKKGVILIVIILIVMVQRPGKNRVIPTKYERRRK